MGAHSGAGLVFDAIHNLLPTSLFYCITFITHFFLTSSQIPTLSPQSQAGGWAVVGVRSWAEVGHGGLKFFLLLVGDMREGVGSGKGIHRAICGCSPALIPCQAQPRAPSPVCWPQEGAPTVLVLLVPYRNAPIATPPAQPSALGDQCITPTLPLLSLWLPKATWSGTAIPKIHRDDAGDTSTQPHRPLAALPYTAVHAQRPPRALPSAPDPINTQ